MQETWIDQIWVHNSNKKYREVQEETRAMMATWSDLVESKNGWEAASEDEEEANLCLMATSEVQSKYEVNISDNKMYAGIEKVIKNT